MRSRYKPWAIEYLKNNFKNQFSIGENEDFSLIEEYVLNRPTYLEIGPGKGQFILNLAKRFPEFNFLVIELDKSIAGTTLKKIDEAEIDNVKLIAGNFYDLAKGLKKSKFCGIFLNFSDPWPKKRHEKRRLTSPNFLIEYAKLLKEEGYIYFKTDNGDFYQYSYEEFNKFKRDIIYLNENYDCSNQDFDAETEFENRYKLQGIAIKRVILKKTKDTLLELPK